MKKSEILRGAKMHLWDGVDDNYYNRSSVEFAHICLAIKHVTCEKHPLMDDIRMMLDKQYTAKAWLASKGIWKDSLENNVLMQAWRHEWVNRLIKYYESIGD